MGGPSGKYGGPSVKYGGVINQLWGASVKYGGVISQVWGGPSVKYGGGHQPTMGGGISQVWGGIYFPTSMYRKSKSTELL